jgi:hypothetical protein
VLDAGAFEGSKVPYKFLRCEYIYAAFSEI